MFCIVSPHETEAEPNLVALPRGIVVSVVSHQMMVMMVTMLIMMMIDHDDDDDDGDVDGDDGVVYRQVVCHSTCRQNLLM